MGQPLSPGFTARQRLVSVIIPTFEKLPLTRRCLKALADNTPGELYETIVVDNASKDGTVQFLKEEQGAGRLRALCNGDNLGFAQACNRGAAMAEGKYLLFLNNDTEVQEGWLEPLIQIAENDQLVGAVGSKLLFPDLTIQHAGVIIVDDRISGDPMFAKHVFYRSPQDLARANLPTTYQALTAACLLVPRIVFDSVAGFDEGYWNGYEDVDLCFKIGKAGHRLVYQPGSVVIHHESQSGPERFRKARANIERLRQKWFKLIQPDFVIWPDQTITSTGADSVRRYEAPRPPSGAGTGLTSILILTHNGLAHTKLCVESIEKFTRLPYELIVVDNGSSDGTADWLVNYATGQPQLRIVRNTTNRGFAAGNNQGLSLARGEQIILLNNDTVVTERWLEGMLAVLERHPRAGIVGPMSNHVSGPQWVQSANYRNLSELPEFASGWSREHRDESFETARAVGFCLLARRALIERIGGLDERFGLGNFEDDDFCIRARLAGFEVRIAKAVFVHHTGSQTFKSAQIGYRELLLRNWALFKAKWNLPVDRPSEQGYLAPKRLPDGTALLIPLPDLGETHASAESGRAWIERTSGGPLDGTGRQQPTKPGNQPACAKLGDLSSARASWSAGRHPEAWKAACEALRLRPFHPDAWLLLAQIARSAGNGRLARNCAQYAKKLAPGWRAAKQFLKQPLPGNTNPGWLMLPPELQQGTSPGENRLSVCLIAKNEEKFLERCLSSIQPIAHQLVLVDTGSTDRTVEIAKAHGAEVYHFAWCEDFSAARNAALEHARSDWVLVLDADEELPAAEHAKLQKDMANPAALALRLPLVCSGEENSGCVYVPRLFRNVPGAHFNGRIHEQIFPSLLPLCKAWGLGSELGTARLLHHGYQHEVVKDRKKVERNLVLLRQAILEQPDDPNIAMNLGLELARSGQLEAGLKHYREAFALMSAQPLAQISPELREMLLTQFTTQLYKRRSHGEVVTLLSSPLARSGKGLTASLHFALGLAQFELQQYAEAAEQMGEVLRKRDLPSLTPCNRDIFSAKPYHCQALSLARLGRAAEAEQTFQQGLSLPEGTGELKLAYARFLASQRRPLEALESLHEFVTRTPECAEAWGLGGQIALSRPEFLEVARDWTWEAVRLFPEDRAILAQRAEALLLSEDAAEARRCWQTVWKQEPKPHYLAALILCELVEDLACTVPEGASAVAEAGQAFIKWYRRGIAMGAHGLILKVNNRTAALRAVLPGAAQMLEAALSEALTPDAAPVELCSA